MEVLIGFFGFLLVIAMAVCVVAFSCIYRGYVLHILWGWFMVPVFGLPNLGVAAAIGVCLIVSLLTAQKPKEKKDGEKEDWKHAAAFVILAPAFALLVGFIAKQFM